MTGIVKFAVAVGVGWLCVMSLPDLARYLRMRTM